MVAPVWMEAPCEIVCWPLGGFHTRLAVGHEKTRSTLSMCASSQWSPRSISLKTATGAPARTHTRVGSDQLVATNGQIHAIPVHPGVILLSMVLATIWPGSYATSLVAARRGRDPQKLARDCNVPGRPIRGSDERAVSCRRGGNTTPDCRLGPERQRTNVRTARMGSARSKERRSALSESRVRIRSTAALAS